MTTSTLRYTSRRPTVGDHMARVAAAGRVMAERQAEQKRMADRAAEREAYTTDLLTDLREDGAVKIGMKVCTIEGKFRSVIDLDWDEDLIRTLVGSTFGEDAEVWGIRADGTYCSEVF